MSRGSWAKHLIWAPVNIFFMIDGLFSSKILPDSLFSHNLCQLFFFSIHLEFINTQIHQSSPTIAVISWWLWLGRICSEQEKLYMPSLFCPSNCPFSNLKFWMLMKFGKIGIWVWTLKMVRNFQALPVKGTKNLQVKNVWGSYFSQDLCLQLTRMHGVHIS